MGRRPNQLVLQLFDRGEKLPDASNRYRHTCRRCGDVFPKGRLEALIGHVIHQCPNISQHDRETVLLYVQQNPSCDPAGIGLKKREKTSKAALQLEDNRHLDQVAFFPQSHPHTLDQSSFMPDQSALDTLAEVSRRHLDLSNERQPFLTRAISPQFDQDNILEQALISELSTPFSQDPSLPCTAVDDNHGGFMTDSSTSENNPQLLAATTCPSEDIDCARSSLVDPQLPDNDRVSKDQDIGRGNIMWQSNMQSSSEIVEPMAIPGATPVTSSIPFYQRQKPRVRSKFSDIRRKEVQGMRKKGACLRCRMLKKPCSDGNPCNTCANIESARLWKGNCIRTKLVEEFSLWSTRLFWTQSTTDVNAAIDSRVARPYHGRIRVELTLWKRTILTFTAFNYSSQPADLTTVGTSDHSNIILLLGDESTAVETLQNAMHSARPSATKRTSQILGTAVQHACMLADLEERSSSRPANSPKSNSRSCYNLQQHLVANTLALWSATNALCIPAEAFRVTVSDSTSDDNFDAATSADESRTPNTIDASSISFRLIIGQVKAALESVCSGLSQKVISELERRLLQRQQSSGFGTLISAILLINSIERLTGLYRSWDTGSNFHPCNGVQHWPFDIPPSTFWPQGQRFADLLIMLLRMRGLPPRSTLTPSGQLNFNVDEVDSNSLSTETHSDLVARPLTLADWAASCRPDVMQLMAVRDTMAPGQGSAPSAWDLRFISRLLLPIGL